MGRRRALQAGRDPGGLGDVEHVRRAVALLGLGMARHRRLLDPVAPVGLLEVDPRPPQVLVDDLGLGVPAARGGHSLLRRRALLLGHVGVALPQRDDVVLERLALALALGAVEVLEVEREQLDVLGLRDRPVARQLLGLLGPPHGERLVALLPLRRRVAQALGRRERLDVDDLVARPHQVIHSLQVVLGGELRVDLVARVLEVDEAVGGELGLLRPRRLLDGRRHVPLALALVLVREVELVERARAVGLRLAAGRVLALQRHVPLAVAVARALDAALERALLDAELAARGLEAVLVEGERDLAGDPPVARALDVPVDERRDRGPGDERLEARGVAAVGDALRERLEQVGRRALRVAADADLAARALAPADLQPYLRGVGPHPGRELALLLDDRDRAPLARDLPARAVAHLHGHDVALRARQLDGRRLLLRRQHGLAHDRAGRAVARRALEREHGGDLGREARRAPCERRAGSCGGAYPGLGGLHRRRPTLRRLPRD